MITSEQPSPSVLVYVHEDRLGDALLKLPAIAALRNAFPVHHITWMAGCGPSIFNSQLAPLVENLIDNVQEQACVGCSWKEHWRHPLKDRFYDIVIDTQTVLRSTLLLRRVPHGLFISPALRFLLSHRRPGPGGYGGSMRKRLLQLIRLASNRPVEPHYQLTLPEDCRRLAAELLPAGPVYVGLAPGAGGRDKCWPLQCYLELAREQQCNGRTPVFFVGPEESEWLTVIRESVPGALIPETDPAANGQTGPLLCMALAERLAVAVANDSGIGHMFAAAGAPLVSLFGRTSVEKFVEDDSGRTVVQAGDFGGDRVEDIPSAVVKAAVEDRLKTPEAARG